jgi:hypothetical protein
MLHFRASHAERLLQAITEANLHFTDGRDKVGCLLFLSPLLVLLHQDFLFPKFLQHCVDLTESRFGYLYF